MDEKLDLDSLTLQAYLKIPRNATRLSSTGRLRRSMIVART